MYVNLWGNHITGLPALLILLVAGFLAYGWPAMIIAKRAHGTAWPGLLMGIPLLNVIAIWVFAFARWPKTDNRTTP
ncbi:hypothetical protein [Tabrizicola sp.]|uniref:hypothetical protein n=1 Tax=Tabrizicola sp. TaxID=2005166 RepID=UPI001A3F8E2C|nr:hypothetical protein [Tabrizicola sp.]MBL9074228.1 hypothetical protein [Tabrizicola sp.]